MNLLSSASSMRGLPYETSVGGRTFPLMTHLGNGGSFDAGEHNPQRLCVR